jgi:hypothetical protein
VPRLRGSTWADPYAARTRPQLQRRHIHHSPRDPHRMTTTRPTAALDTAHITTDIESVFPSTAAPTSWVTNMTAMPSSRCNSRKSSDLDLNGNVERSCRLVGQQYRRVARQRQRDHRPLTGTGALTRTVLPQANACDDPPGRRSSRHRHQARQPQLPSDRDHCVPQERRHAGESCGDGEPRLNSYDAAL